MPLKWLSDIPPPADREYITGYGAFAEDPLAIINLADFPGSWYSDGSGGPNARTVPLRRCGSAYVLISGVNDGCQLIGGFTTPPPGEHQTVNRAELLPAILLAERTIGDILLHSDSLYVVQGFAEARHLHPYGANGDMWHRLGLAVRHRTGTFGITKVKAHQDVSDLDFSHDYPTVHFVGNSYADALADYVAEADECVVPIDAVLDYQSLVKMHSRIMHRIICTHMGKFTTLPKRDLVPRGHRARLVPLTLRQRVERRNISHRDLVWSTHRVSCHTCSQASSIKDAIRWITGPCLVSFVAQAPGGDILRRNFPLQIGHHSAHPTHVLKHLHGFVYCDVCGYYATTSTQTRGKLEKLRYECNGPSRVGAGKDYLSRFRRGLPPKANLGWPDDHRM